MTQDDVPSRFAVDFAGATLLGIYRVEKKIADGGMGSVWLAEDTNLGRKVVVKVPHVRFLGESGFRARFTREITELVRLEHPNIVRILAQGTHQEIPFFVLQYLRGGSLESRLREDGEGPRGPEAVAPWLRTIADTLDFVHGRGVVHRDVKPENILFDEEGHVFLSDFGIAKALEEDLDVTEAGTGVGSPKYMAPEQGFGKPVEGAADQYGLATTVYETIARRLPFEGSSALELLLNKQNEPPTPLIDLAPDVPAACTDAVMRGLASDPGERFAGCREFADAFLSGAGIFEGTPPAGTGAPGTVSTRLNLFAAAASVALLAAVVLIVGFAAGWFSPGTPTTDGDEGEAPFEVVLLSPGAEPRSVLRYHPLAGADTTMAIGITSEESRKHDEQKPVEISLPRISFRIRLEVSEVSPDGDISFLWEAVETNLDPAEGTPAPYREGMRKVAKAIEGRSGSGRMSAHGINRGLSHDSPPPEDPDAQPLHTLLCEILEQVCTPLPEVPVGVGARWEVTIAKYHIEGMRVTQTVTYELTSFDDKGACLRLYVALVGPNQEFAHRDIPAEANARLNTAHGNGKGEIVVEFDRLGERSFWMDVASRMELSVAKEDGRQELSVSRKFRYETHREESRFTAAQSIVEAIVAKYPDLVRLTIHAIPTGETESRIIACNVAEKRGKPSDPEDLQAMKTLETVVLREGDALDVTAPIVDPAGKAIAATGITLSFTGGATERDLVEKGEVIARELTAAIRAAEEALW